MSNIFFQGGQVWWLRKLGLIGGRACRAAASMVAASCKGAIPASSVCMSVSTMCECASRPRSAAQLWLVSCMQHQLLVHDHTPDTDMVPCHTVALHLSHYYVLCWHMMQASAPHAEFQALRTDLRAAQCAPKMAALQTHPSLTAVEHEISVCSPTGMVAPAGHLAL